MHEKPTRDEIPIVVIRNLIKYPSISKYFSDTIRSLITNQKYSVIDLLEIQLIRYLFVNNDGLTNFDTYLVEKEFTNVSVPINRLQTNFISEYRAVYSELYVASLLDQEGMKNITFIAEEDNPDIQYVDKDVIKYAEIKNLDDSDPEYPIIYNKLEAYSLLDPRYKCSFYIRLNNEIATRFKSLTQYGKCLKIAVNKLIEGLDEYIDRQDLEDRIFHINQFEFIVSFNKNVPDFNLMYGGDVLKYGSNKDIFLKMSSVYSRFINKSAEGIRQLAKKRDNNLAAINDDRLYIILNVGRYADFIPDKLESLINKLAGDLGINNLVTLKIIF